TLVRTKAFLMRDVALATAPPIWTTLPAAWWGSILIHRQCETLVVTIAAPIRYVVGARHQLPFLSKTFDVVTSFELIKYLLLMRRIIWWKCDAPSRRGASCRLNA